MKKLFFAIGILFSTGVNAQKTITVELPACLEFVADASESPETGLKLQNKPSFNMDGACIGFNKHYFDLVNKKLFKEFTSD